MGTPIYIFLYSVPALSQTFLQEWIVTTIHFEASVRVIQTSYTIYLTKQARLTSALFVGISLPEQWAGHLPLKVDRARCSTSSITMFATVTET